MSLALAGLLLARSLLPMADAGPTSTLFVRVTFYTLTGRMASGSTTRPGAAACSGYIPFKTLLELPDGRVVECLDRGHGDWYWNRDTGWDGWVDVWVASRSEGLAQIEAAYGLNALAIVQRWGADPDE